MTPHDGATELTMLRQRWRRWTMVVELFARRRRGRRQVDPASYEALQRELVSACRALAAAGGERRAYYEALDELARPWLTCRVLEQADAEILSDLLLRSQRVDRELNGRGWSGVGRRTVLALAAAPPAAALVWGGGRAWPALAGVLAEQWRALRLTLAQSTDTQRLIAGGFVVALVAALLLRVSGR